MLTTTTIETTAEELRGFLLCHNPVLVSAAHRRGYIYHQRKPRFFAEIPEVNPALKNTLPVKEGANIFLSFIGRDKTMRLFVIIVSENFDRASSRLHKVLHACAQWYGTCLQQNERGKTEFFLFSDYNRMTPALQIIQLKKAKQFIVSHRGGVEICASEESMHSYPEELGYPEAFLREGTVNVL